MAWNDNIEGYEALAIASSTERRIRVVAGPGSGKTFSLMRRIARLLESGVNPQSILLATFTRTAAQDLKKELIQLGVAGAEEVRAGTLHSFCYRILRKDAVLEITGRHPRPLFKYETEFVMEDLKRKTRLGKKPIEKKIKDFESAWAKLQSDTPGWPQDANDKVFQNTLISYLRFHKAMLIGEVIPEALKYLRNNPQADERTMFDYVFVDEYQDLNKAEQELINTVAANSHFMVIGDEDQSIYERFRNAHPEGIRTFNQQHEGTVDYALTVCRRCPTDIVKAADSFIQNNLNREPRHLVPRPENPEGVIHSIQWPSFSDEQDGIVAFIEKKIKDGINPGKILVMCPWRKIGYAIKEKLIAHAIEAHSFFSEEIFEEVNAQKAMTFLNLMVDKNDRVALRCWIGFGSSTANVSGYEAITSFCEKNGVSPYEAIEQLTEGKISITYTGHIVSRFKELKELLAKYSTLKPTEIIAELFPKSETWAFPFLELLTEYTDENSIEEIQNEIRLNVINPEMPLDVDYVRIMSIHKSKGLTSDISIICGVVEGLIPRTENDLQGDEATRFIEEQRRLFFVGITRPKQELVISSVNKIPKTLAYQLKQKVPWTLSSETRAIASTFLSQLGDDFPDAVAGEDWQF
jgi:DNA helicase-2/ATP-dependent DNA helicase PcrA